MATMKEKREKAAKMAAIRERITKGDIPEIKPLKATDELNSIRPDLHKPQDYENRDMIFYAYEMNISRMSVTPYYALTVATADEPENMFEVTSGGKSIVAQIEKLEDLNIEFPILIRFSHQGNSPYMIFL